MIQVKLKEKINGHLPKGAVGQITAEDYNNFGVGDDIVTPWSVKVFINNDTMYILNKKLEIA